MPAQARFALTALALVVVGGLLLYAGSRPRQDLDQSTEMQAFRSTVLATEKPVVVNFTATWCGVCEEQKPQLRETQRMYGGVAQFATIDVDEMPDVAARYEISGVPTTLIFKKGELVERLDGLYAADEIGARLSPYAKP